MKHLFIVNPVAGKQKPEEKIKLIHASADRVPGGLSGGFEAYVTRAPMDAVAKIRSAAAEEDEAPDYPVTVFFSREGYLKKITPQSLRMASDQKYKEGDGPFLQWEAANRDELLVFTDRQQCYKTRLSDFDDTKASALGDYLHTKL